MRIVYKSIVGSSDVMIYFWKILLQFGRFSWIRDVSYELNALFIPDNDAKTNSSFFFCFKIRLQKSAANGYLYKFIFSD